MSNRLKTSFGWCLDQTPSRFRVYQNPWYRWLTLGSPLLQTLIQRRHPENPQLHYIEPLTLLARAFPGDCCLMGLGGAGVAHALTSVSSSFIIDAVECSDEVITLATRYFATDKLTNLTIHHQSAHTFVINPSKIYQHVLLDLHNGTDYPCECSQTDFFIQCHNLLAPGGMLAINFTLLRNKREMIQALRQIFNGAIITLPVRHTGNCIVLACKSSTANDFIHLLQSARLINEIYWSTAWGSYAKAPSRRAARFENSPLDLNRLDLNR